ncbi:MAG TPA: polysaccharide deacetylase family protein [Terriglobales bacterium]|nr:polysaccharide deacetylase family protein [Terriglobales bacterium]
MPQPAIVFLMYHELEVAGRAICETEPGYARYVLPLATFREQMQWIRQSGLRSLSVSEALDFPSDPSICITFDDGCETDLIAAAPVLREFGLGATFYVTAGRLGTQGYLSEHQLRELNAQHFEIGCHSMTHAYLSDIGDADLKREIADAKDRIEQILGHGIDHFSCPGGRYDKRAFDTARRAGYKTVANSEFHANSAGTDRYKLGRVAMLRDMNLDEFSAICHGRGLWKKRLAHATRRGAQWLLGNSNYDRVRSAILGEPQ